MAERMKRCITEPPIQIDHAPYTVTVKVGTATATQDTSDIEALLEYARTAMGAA
jgi:GGDEF domain-containing protein